MSHQKDAYSVLSSFDLNGRPLRTETNLGGGASRVEEFEYNQVGFLKQTTVHDLET
ncbi:MAG: hypothetical protein IT384_29255, partial [Deltaproteobacteria bacterium]|nr:hypothetical protein [Deltaproteobacteria bacterium]